MSEPLRIGIAGITGRMGREITALARNDERIRLVGGVSRREPADDLFTDLLVTSDLDRLLLEIDLLIDFTLPEATSSIAAAASRARVPLLCGVTGPRRNGHRGARIGGGAHSGALVAQSQPGAAARRRSGSATGGGTR